MTPRATPKIRDAGFRALNAFHRTIIAASHQRIGASALGMEIIELETRGRRSGHTHRTLLAVPVVDGETLVLVASKGGDDRHPDWYLNLLRHEVVHVNLQGSRRSMRARVANDEERDAYWPRVVASYSRYDAYQRRSRRMVPLVICQPLSDDPVRAPRSAPPGP